MADGDEEFVCASASISTLPDRVFVARCAHSALPALMHSITGLLLVLPHDHLFTLTVHHEEVSLMMSEPLLPHFAAHRAALDVSPQVWRAFSIRNTSDAPLLSLLIARLAESNVSLLNATLTSSDLVLVRNADVPLAFDQMRRCLATFEGCGASFDWKRALAVNALGRCGSKQ
jgi:hypothetical protein